MPAKAATTHFTPAEVFSTTGISVPKQNQWDDRGIIRPSPLDKRPTGSGSYRLVCAATVYLFAVTDAGVRQGFPARRAAAAARLFAVEQPGRPANALYEFGVTLLVIKQRGAEIVNAPFEASLSDICGRPFETATILNLTHIIKTVDEKLISIKGKTK